MKDFEQYNQGQDDDFNRLQEGLSELRLRSAIEQAAHQRRHQQKVRLGWWWALIVLGALFIGWVLFSLTAERKPAPSPTLLPPGSSPATPPTAPLPATENQPSPLAHTVLPSPTLPPKAQLRSVQNNLISKDFLQLIDTFLIENRQKNTRFASDPKWLKIASLLEQKQPAEAKNLIFSFESQPEETDWLLGGALLEEGKSPEARAVFESVARSPSHPRQSQALTLLRLWPGE